MFLLLTITDSRTSSELALNARQGNGLRVGTGGVVTPAGYRDIFIVQCIWLLSVVVRIRHHWW